MRAVLLVVLFCIVACSPQSPRYPTAADQITQGLERSAAVDRKIRGNPVNIPSSIRNALIPERKLRLAANTEQAAQRFDINVREVPAETFFMGLIKGSNMSIVVNPEVKGDVTLSMKGVTIDEVLQAVRDIYGFDFKPTSYGYEIIPGGIATRVFNINYLDVSREGESNISIDGGQPTQISNSSDGSSQITRATNNNALTSGDQKGSSNPATTSYIETKSKSHFWNSLRKSLESMVGDHDGRSVVVEPQAGVVVVKAFPSEMQQVASFLQNVQSNMDREVILEAKILEVQLSDNFQTGIDWSVLGIKQGNGYGLEASTDFEGTTSNQAFTLNASGQSFSAAIKLLSAEGNVQVLSSPRVSTVNNQKAVIKVGDEEYFVTNLSNSTLATGAAANTTQNVNLTPFFSGIALDVTPQIDPAGNVILYIHPTISKVIQQNKVITLQNGSISLPSAYSSIRESDSIIRARNNQVIVLGGLMQNKTNEALQGAPGLSRVPFLGALFRNSKQASQKTELVILLRPIVVGANTWFQQMDQEVDRFHRLNRGFHVGDRPEVFGNLGEFKNNP